MQDQANREKISAERFHEEMQFSFSVHLDERWNPNDRNDFTREKNQRIKSGLYVEGFGARRIECHSA